MTARIPVRTLMPLLALALCLVVAVAPAQAVRAEDEMAAAGQPRMTPKPPPEGVAYWRHAETEERVEWGAVGMEIDRWDTREHGIWHESLLWYRYRLLYPDGSVYATGYDWVERDSPDETLKPGRWATHNWPVASAESLLEFDFVAVEATDVGADADSLVSSYTRWYPSPPALRGSGTGSPWAAFADQRLGLRANSPFAQSRREQAVHAYIEHTNEWDRYWGDVQVEAVRDTESQIQLARLLEEPSDLAVNYLGELRERLGEDERYRGSAADTFDLPLKTDATSLFEGVGEGPRTEREEEPEQARIPTRLFEEAPTLDPRTNVQAEEMAATLARRLDPLRTEAELVRRYDAHELDVHLGLYSGSRETGPGDPFESGPLGGATGDGVMLVSAETGLGATQRAVREIEQAARTIEARTRFAQLAAGGEILSFEPVEEAAFALVSDPGRGEGRGAIVRDYRVRSGSLDVRDLLTGATHDEADELAPLDELETWEHGFRVNAEEPRTWRSLQEALAEATETAEHEMLRMPLPARRADVTAAWARYLDARSRD